MAFSRMRVPAVSLQGDALTRAMVGIGMQFTAEATTSPNIEDTVLAASAVGMVDDDLRVLSVLVTWLGVHHGRLNADRLIQLVTANPELRVRAFWSAIAHWLKSDRRFAKLLKWEGERVDLLRVGSDFQVRRRGEDARFVNSCLRVPADVLRDRVGDVLTPSALAKCHPVYRQRIITGPSYRADMWAHLERDPSLSTAELARRTYGSFATAWQVRRDFSLVVVPRRSRTT